jgi:co-chaperonin GroES (HSP10)
LTITQDRVLIRADREDKAPKQTASGIYLAQSLAAAVDGSDLGESWFVGTIVRLGPLVRRFDVRETVHDWLLELEQHGHDISPVELKVLRMRIRALPKEHVDPLNVGDRVVFSWASGQQIAIDDDKYVVLRADDILGILSDDE